MVGPCLLPSQEPQALFPQALAEKMPIKDLESSASLWDLIEISEFYASEMGKIIPIL